MTYTWSKAQVGDASPTFTVEVTDEQIADFCRAARYENLVYTNQPAARETGLPGIIAPPAMLFAYAPANIPVHGEPVEPPPTNISIRFQGTMVTHGDTITSQTVLADKYQQGEERFLTFRVTAHNQRGELVGDYAVTYLWERVGETNAT